jgi:membrane associated rhomboid family serine protease
MFPLRDSQPSEKQPLLTMALILVNVLVFFYQLSLGDFELNDFLARCGAVPARLDWPDLFTSIFLHGGWMHLIGNMWFLWVFGDNIEDILGRGNYLVFYIACGLAGGLGHILLNPTSQVPAVGASGAISGIMGAYLLKFPQSRITTLVFFILTVEIPALFMIGYWFVTQIFSGVGSLAATGTQQGGTAWFAHIGGFIAGCVLIQLLPTRSRWQVRRDHGW